MPTGGIPTVPVFAVGAWTWKRLISPSASGAESLFSRWSLAWLIRSPRSLYGRPNGFARALDLTLLPVWICRGRVGLRRNPVSPQHGLPPRRTIDRYHAHRLPSRNVFHTLRTDRGSAWFRGPHI